MKTHNLKTLLAVFAIACFASCEQETISPSKNENKRIPAFADEAEVGDVHAGTVQGFKDGPALQAEFSSPSFLAAGPESSLYVFDSGNLKIRKISAEGNVTTVFDLTTVGMNGIGGMAVDKDGSIYVSHGTQIKKISSDGNEIEVVAGSGQGISVPMKDGPALEATFAGPTGLVLNKDGCLFIVDTYNNAIRLLSGKKVSTLAGGNRDYEPYEKPRDGVGKVAEFDEPTLLALGYNNDLYVTGGWWDQIRKVDAEGNVSTVFPGLGEYDSDNVERYSGIAFGTNGKLYTTHRFIPHGGESFIFFTLDEITPGDFQSNRLGSTYYYSDEGEYDFSSAHGLTYPTGTAVIGNTLFYANTGEHRIRKLKIQ